jgi:hypothetical protein
MAAAFWSRRCCGTTWWTGLWLKIYPITLGKGKRLFAEGTMPAAFELMDAKASPSGVIVAYYGRAGQVKTGSFD